MHLRRLLSLVAASSIALASSAADLTGAGSTFSQPIYAKWIHSFELKNPDIHIRYQPTNSEGGIESLRNAVLDFADSDFPPPDNQQLKSFPIAVGAVVPAYNIPGFLGDLRLTPQTLAGIYLGKIKQWNDPAIQRTNHGTKLPTSEIVVIHRSDASGTTFIWSDYLSKMSPDWQTAVGRGTTLHWPAGETAKGNDGVAAMVTTTANSIGYVEFIYGVQRKLSMAAVQNASGTFVQPDIPSITEAAATAVVPDDFRVSITNPPGAHAYPIASFTWFLIPPHNNDQKKRQDLFQFLNWILSTGQRQVAALGYIPIPSDLLIREQAAVTRAQAVRE